MVNVITSNYSENGNGSKSEYRFNTSSWHLLNQISFNYWLHVTPPYYVVRFNIRIAQITLNYRYRRKGCFLGNLFWKNCKLL